MHETNSQCFPPGSLFPSKILSGGVSTHCNHSAPSTVEEHQNFDYSKGELLPDLSNVKTGKGAGPFTDPTDWHPPGHGGVCPYIDSVAGFLQLLMDPDLPSRIQEMFSCVYAIAFHKDCWPNNPQKSNQQTLERNPDTS
jgi:hypothetical protein